MRALLLSFLAVICLAAPCIAARAQDGPEDDRWKTEDNLAIDASSAVADLSATGERSVDALESYDVKLTLGTLRDPAGFSVVCGRGGASLHEFAKGTAELEQLEGTVSKPVCGGSGKPADPFTLSFLLRHEEGGAKTLFATLLFLPIHIAKSDLTSMESPLDEQPGDLNSDGSPKNPIEMNPSKVQTSHVELTLPEKWTPVRLPQSIHADSRFASYDYTVAYNDGKLVTDQKLVLKVDTVPVADFKEYTAWASDSKVGNGETRTLLDTPLSQHIAPLLPTNAEQTKTVQLFQQAIRAEQEKKLDEADALLKQVQARSPDMPVLHHMLGAAAESRSDYARALTEYQTELRLFPDETVEFEAIARMQDKLKENDAALDTLQQWMIASPYSYFPAVDLMNLYRRMGRDDLALRAGDEAMNIMNKDARRAMAFLLLYGREQMLNGQVEAARRTLNELLDLTSDVQMTNDAAYYLAQQGVDLERAETTVRDSLSQFEGPGDSGNEHHYTQTPQRFTDLLFSTWDTLGWILFREGKLTEASEYLNAAWVNKQDPAMAYHLGSLLEKNDKITAAFDIYTLGLATKEAKETTAAADPDVVALHAAYNRLKAVGAVTTILDPEKRLVAMRTFDFGPAKGFQGKVETTLVLRHDSMFASPTDGPAIDLSPAKVPSVLFPAASEAGMTRQASITCAATCMVTFEPTK